MRETVTFRSEGLHCAADLLLTEESKERPAAAIVMGRGFGGVREGNRAEADFFNAAGFVVLSIDYRWFGTSEGEPRGRLHPLDQVEDFRNAISFLEGRPEVDNERIGLWGTSFAGGTVLYTAAIDRRSRAVVAQMPIVDGGRWLRSLRSTVEWEELTLSLAEDRRSRFAGSPGQRIKLSGRVSLGELAVMPGDDEQAAHFAKLKASQPSWRDDITMESLESVIDFRPSAVMGQISPGAVCIVTAAGHDPVHPLDQILEAYENCHEPKMLYLANHRGMDLRFDPGWSECLQVAVDWFGSHLAGRAQ